MLYEVIEGTINGRSIGEEIELEEEEAKAFGPKYLIPLKASKKKTKADEDEDQEEEDGVDTKDMKPMKTTDIKTSKTK